MANEVQPSKLLDSFQYFKFKKQNPNSHKPKKFRSLIHATILPHVTHFAYALVDFKCMVFDLFTKKKRAPKLPKYQKCLITKRNKLVSFIKLHLKWCSCHVTPVTDSSQVCNYSYYSVCDAAICTQEENYEDERETEYLQWLEERESTEIEMNEIDRLAEEFIASCYEKFLLEKQESYRRYEEMMARSL
ncbi:cotton fiber protein [Rhynchospora pubera]|uniref:Cotton fiber protein n=1 Tax=Rhynchospora pubera TaxID=906938 RepID=A0AAV8F288_9POAL|nr:cotton fiber protein [Rhynchospora pubera]